MLARTWKNPNPGTLLVNMTWKELLWKRVWRPLQKLTMQMTTWSQDSTSDVHPKELEARSQRGIPMPMFVAALFTVAKMWKQRTCPSVNEKINQVWHTHTHSLEQEGSSDTGYPVDETWGRYAAWNEPVKRRGYISQDSTNGRILEGSHSQTQTVERRGPGPGKGEWELLFDGYGAPVWEDGKVLKSEDGDGDPTVWMYRTPLNCTPKTVKMVRLKCNLSQFC